MEKEKIERLRRYGKAVYKTHNVKYGIFYGDTLDDFLQMLYLYALKHPSDSIKLLVWKVKHKEYMTAHNERFYQTRNMIPFSEFELNDNLEYIERRLLAEDMQEDESDIISELAEKIYPLKRYESSRFGFVEYMNGVSIGKEKQLNCRKKLFKLRFDILDFLKEKERISEREYIRLYQLAESLTERPKQERKLIQDESHNYFRKYRAEHREHYRELDRKAYRLKKGKTSEKD